MAGYHVSPLNVVGMVPIEVNASNQLKYGRNILRDLSGIFYEEQLQRVKAPDFFSISDVVRKSGKRALVEWRGWLEKINSWIPESDF